VRTVAPFVLAVALLAGCSSPTPRQRLVDSTNKKCDIINDRFAGDLAYGDSIGPDDVGRMTKRLKLIRDLRDHASKSAPKMEKAELDDWLKKLGLYIKDLENMRNAIQNLWNTRTVADIWFSIAASETLASAKATTAPAKRYGLDRCAKGSDWEQLPQ
jgi:hypothetical protein